MKFENDWTYPEGLKCPKCKGDCIAVHVVNEVNGQAVGPYDVHTCEDCGYETYEDGKNDG